MTSLTHKITNFYLYFPQKSVQLMVLEAEESDRCVICCLILFSMSVIDDFNFCRTKKKIVNKNIDTKIILLFNKTDVLKKM
jgi:hypothetical protein